METCNLFDIDQSDLTLSFSTFAITPPTLSPNIPSLYYPSAFLNSPTLCGLSFPASTLTTTFVPSPPPPASLPFPSPDWSLSPSELSALPPLSAVPQCPCPPPPAFPAPSLSESTDFFNSFDWIRPIEESAPKFDYKSPHKRTRSAPSQLTSSRDSSDFDSAEVTPPASLPRLRHSSPDKRRAKRLKLTEGEAEKHLPHLTLAMIEGSSMEWSQEKEEMRREDAITTEEEEEEKVEKVERAVLDEGQVRNRQHEIVKRVEEIMAWTREQLNNAKLEQPLFIADLKTGNLPHTHEERHNAFHVLYRNIDQQLLAWLHMCDDLWRDEVLVTDIAWQIYRLRDARNEYTCQLRLLREELLDAVISRGALNSTPRAALIIEEQPMPIVVCKNRNRKQPISLKLITASAVTKVTATDRVEAVSVQNDTGAVSTSSKKNVMGYTTLVDDKAVFTGLDFSLGTRGNTRYISFSVNATIQSQTNQSQQPIKLQSEQRVPFIVYTNDIQKPDMIARSFERWLFATGPASVSWPQFANCLQLCYLDATGQEKSAPQRPLSLQDLHYIHTQCFGGIPLIMRHQVQIFWRWFGPILRRISCAQFHMRDMWLHGIIFGFATASFAARILATAPASSTLLRFSPPNNLATNAMSLLAAQSDTAGALLMSYKNGNGEIICDGTLITTHNLPAYLQETPNKHIVSHQGYALSTTEVLSPFIVLSMRKVAAPPNPV